MISRFAKTLIATACLTATTLAATAHAASAESVADFYKGKSIQIIVGFGAGGGYDLYARALGRHLGKHVPGNPTIVVQNMAGAGSIRAANYVYAGSPKDGTVIAAVNQNASMYQILGGAGARFEAAHLQWLGSMTNSNGTVYTWHTSGIKTLDDAKLKEVPMGAVGAQSDSVIFPNLINELLGTKFKPITGYTGSTQIHLAMERGEVMGRGGNSWSSFRTANLSWLKENKVNMLVQVGFKKEAELPQVPLLLDLVKDETSKSVIRVISLPTAIGYGHWLAPEVPKDRLAALRTAYAAVMKDPEFIKEAAKARMDIRFQTGAEVEALIKQVIKTPKPVLDRTTQILKW
jgi:tripartite-type tricarboxylate transporter receptor subunit TctC